MMFAGLCSDARLVDLRTWSITCIATRASSLDWYQDQVSGCVAVGAKQKISLFLWTAYARTLLSITNAFDISAPWTTLWPTTAISRKLEMGPCLGSVRSATASAKASFWSLMGCGGVYCHEKSE